jgi:hypothetical protein
VDALRAEIALRYGHKKHEPELRLNLIAVKRIRTLERYLELRYGRPLPDDAAGCEDLVILLNHVAQNPIDPQGKMRRSIHLWAPWMPPHEAQALVGVIAADPRRYKASTLGKLLRLTEEEHAIIGAETIRPHTVTDADMKAKDRRLRRERKRAARAVNRSGRKRGRPRTEGVRPWDALGMSRARFYRLLKAGTLPSVETRTPAPKVRRKMRPPYKKGSYRGDAISVSRSRATPQPPWQPRPLNVAGLNLEKFGIVAIRVLHRNRVMASWQQMTRETNQRGVNERRCVPD